MFLGALTALGGCASQTKIIVTGYREKAFGAAITHHAQGDPRTFSFQRSELRDSDDIRPAPELLEALAAHGFAATGAPGARYALTVAHSSRPAATKVEAQCQPALSPGGCEAPSQGRPRTLFGSMRYVHAVSIRLTNAQTGQVVYKVAAAATNGNRNGDTISPCLEALAVNRFPPDRETFVDGEAVLNAAECGP
ncbi:hypothetical protein AB4Y33_28795 [Paraburkholderia sp. BR14319]